MYLEEFRRQEFEYPLVVGPPVVDANKGQIAVIFQFPFPEELSFKTLNPAPDSPTGAPKILEQDISICFAPGVRH